MHYLRNFQVSGSGGHNLLLLFIRPIRRDGDKVSNFLDDPHNGSRSTDELLGVCLRAATSVMDFAWG